MVFIPLLLGQAFCFHLHHQFSVTLFLVTFLFGVLYQVYLLYLNDHADEATDKANEQYWLSGGSRVLPQGKLKPGDLLAGAQIALVCLVGLTLFMATSLDRPWTPVALAVAVSLCWAYNRPPLQLSYRGHGEILQGLGCGIVLPLIGFYTQLGSLQNFPWAALIPLYLIFHAGNVVTALPDYQSDKRNRKRTCPVRLGEYRGRTTAVLLLAVAYVSVVIASPERSPIGLTIAVVPSVLVLLLITGSGMLRSANVADFWVCRQFVTWVSASQAWLLCAWTGVLFMGSPA